MRRTLTTLAIWLMLPALAAAQKANPAPATIQVTSRIVYVDVIVRDSKGHVVHGLLQQDFKLEEDGKPQTIDYFAAHSIDLTAPSQTAQAPHAIPNGSAPENEFSNISDRGTAPGAVNIILFDLVNTPATDQVTARRQLLKFLATLPRGQQIALFVLSDRLRMIQNFTGSSDRLADAAQHINPQDFNLIESKISAMQDLDMVVNFAKAVGGPGGAALMRMAKANAQQDATVGWDIRARITVAALAELARATSGYAGRKNLLWLAESFPLAVGAQLNDTKFERASTVPGARETANLLASAQIAVYPISLLGLETSGVSFATSGSGETSPVGGPAGSPLNPQNERHDQRSISGPRAPQGTDDRPCRPDRRRSFCRNE